MAESSYFAGELPPQHATGDAEPLQEPAAAATGSTAAPGIPAPREEGPCEAPFPVKPRTEKHYRAHLRSMTRYSEALRRESPDENEAVGVTLTDLVTDFLARSDLAPSTAKGYRAALLFEARSLAHRARSAALQAEARRLIPLLEERRQVGGRPREKETIRLMPEADYHELVAELHGRAISGSLWAARASAWLMAGVITGVRPGEWTSARWHPEQPQILIVATGKTHLCEPAFVREQMNQELADRQRQGLDLHESAEREIPIGSEFDREAVASHMRNLASWLMAWPHQQTHRGPGRPPRADLSALPLTPLEQLTPEQLEQGFEAYYNGARSVIRQACMRLWQGEKLYSLYSARRQFSANTRAALGPARASTLMGHSAPDSPSAAFYGKQGSAHDRFRRMGAERIREQGSAMPEEVRARLGALRLGESKDDQEQSFGDE